MRVTAAPPVKWLRRIQKKLWKGRPLTGPEKARILLWVKEARLDTGGSE